MPAGRTSGLTFDVNVPLDKGSRAVGADACVRPRRCAAIRPCSEPDVVMRLMVGLEEVLARSERRATVDPNRQFFQELADKRLLSAFSSEARCSAGKLR